MYHVIFVVGAVALAIGHVASIAGHLQQGRRPFSDLPVSEKTKVFADGLLATGYAASLFAIGSH
jgi:hypothetical protein